MGPLEGVRVVEMAGIGPVPFAAMVLADLGADVVRVDRVGDEGTDDAPSPHHFTRRGRTSVAVDLKQTAGGDVVRRLLDRADVCVEGFRPGVMERLGLGPEECLERNPRLVYARMTGFGQDGPLASAAGHDINYISLAGALGHLGVEGQPPPPPLTLVGDFGGGGMLLMVGVLGALIHQQRTGAGQVVDVAMVDGALLLMAPVYDNFARGAWNEERGRNLVDGGAHFYGAYETADGTYISVGAIEPQFYAAFLEGLGLAGVDLPEQLDTAAWPEMRARVGAIFRTRTRDEWLQEFAALDACVTPVLTMVDAPEHPQNRARGTFGDVFGAIQPMPAPRFADTPASLGLPPPVAGEHTVEIATSLGYSEQELDALLATGAVAQAGGTGRRRST